MKSLKLTAVLLAVCVMQGENFKIFLSAFVEFFPRGGGVKSTSIRRYIYKQTTSEIATLMIFVRLAAGYVTQIGASSHGIKC